ncbi:hypothetical protein H8S20_17380 [Clostridium sp. NSJ-6]|uniref:Uncharacterized protein n=1 Tax=Clostridium hominis TaxID=2763036 RepID=A0ABR7DII6_9CLOT|nr:hypothetical protein [Clostridium hominis]MBC5630633.1 hypothetical protein [Clostridium hominis]
MEELLKHDLEDAYFYMHIPNLIIKLPISEVVVSEDGINLELGTDGNSTLTIWKEASEVIKVRRPSNIVGIFEYCYLIKNEYKEPIGYIGK